MGDAGRSPQRAAVVVAYDGSVPATAAVRWAAQESLADQRPLEVVVAWRRALTGRGRTAGDGFARALAQVLADRAVALAREVLGASAPIRSSVVRGPAAGAVRARAGRAHLLVMGTSGHLGPLGALLGSVSRDVVHHVDVPVVLLGPHAAAYLETRVLLPCSRGRVSPAAVEWAVHRARDRPRRVLHLLDSWTAPGALSLGYGPGSSVHRARDEARRAHEAAVDRLRRQATEGVATQGPVVTADLVEGRIADVEYARSFPGDLLVLSAAELPDRPPLTATRCPIVVVPDRPALAAGHDTAGDRAAVAT
jgi:nucleotide-binding universal stress UspA family protein